MNAPTYWLGKRLRTYLGRINPRQSLGDRTAARCAAFVCDADAPRYRAGQEVASVHQKDQGRSSGVKINAAMADIIQNPTAVEPRLTEIGHDCQPGSERGSPNHGS